jgi:hypothetical protein
MDVSSLKKQVVSSSPPPKRAEEANNKPAEKPPVKSETAKANAAVQAQPVINSQGQVTGRKLNVSA